MSFYICAMCGRKTTPFVFIGNEAIGPKCAQRRGFTKAKATKGSRISFPAYKPKKTSYPQTLDLFEDETLQSPGT